MKNRNRKSKKVNLANLRTFFLACELKPESDLWSVIDPFAYDVKPAFIFGSLGVISYEPEAYSIIDIDENSSPLLGYICTITHPDTILLLDKLKGVQGPEAFNYHQRKLVHAYTDIEEMHNAWCYVLSEKVLDHYRQIEQIEFGIFEEDEKLIDLLEKIEENN
jgi:hypothetical protein